MGQKWTAVSPLCLRRCAVLICLLLCFQMRRPDAAKRSISDPVTTVLPRASAVCCRKRNVSSLMDSSPSTLEARKSVAVVCVAVAAILSKEECRSISTIVEYVCQTALNVKGRITYGSVFAHCVFSLFICQSEPTHLRKTFRLSPP